MIDLSKDSRLRWSGGCGRPEGSPQPERNRKRRAMGGASSFCL